MKYKILAILIVVFSAFGGCITEFIPVTDETANLLVVEGMVTDQFRRYKIKITRAMPLGDFLNPIPVNGCWVSIIDENNVFYNLSEYPAGIYSTDSTIFRGHPGGKYTLRIIAGGQTYMSSPMEMLPVPPIDSLYYEKVVFVESSDFGKSEEGCRIYLNTYDHEKKCMYYKWNFIETWMIRLPFSTPKSICWITKPSEDILIKNTSIYDQSRVTKYPVLLVTNETDRLKEKYSILVKQYSLNQDEYNYWEKLRNVYENVGGLYDVTPMSISGNIYCLNNPDEKVLGYFSVSAVTEKRIFIKERFEGMPYLYWNCIDDTIYGGSNVFIEGLDSYKWVIEDHTYDPSNQFRVITFTKDCADCTTRGTTTKPSFWED
jgi:hypothetical protein